MKKERLGRGTQGAGAGGRKRGGGLHEDGKPAGTEKGRDGLVTGKPVFLEDVLQGDTWW